jgi:ABC-type enterochelin transport system ATPase subunit
VQIFHGSRKAPPNAVIGFGIAGMTILSAVAKELNRAVLVVTHDARVLGFAERIIHIENGSFIRDGQADRKVHRKPGPFGACFRPASRR